MSSMLSFHDRSHRIAKPGFNRWLVPPVAFCVHLCIGQAYAFSVFNLPMTKLLGISASGPGDWKLTELGWIFSIVMAFLGISSAMFTAGCLGLRRDPASGGRDPDGHQRREALSVA
jgi:hypothetical protein